MTGFKGLPAINTLRVFEAAARLGSFKLAADELCLTPSAVSHQIKALESQLGMSLFERQGRQVILTSDGHEYARVIRGAFDSILLGAHEVQCMRQVTPIRLRVAKFFGQQVLKPWFEEFEKSHPTIRLEITWEDDLFTIVDDAFNEQRFDAAIVWGGGYWEGYEVHALKETEVTVLGAPELAKHPLPLKDVSLLAEYPWVINRQVPSGWGWWLSMVGESELKSQYPHIEVDNLDQALEAGCQGEGLILGDYQTYQGFINNGDVSLFSHRLLPSQAFFLLYPSEQKVIPELETFVVWVVGKARKSLSPVRINYWPGMKGNVDEVKEGMSESL